MAESALAEPTQERHIDPEPAEGGILPSVPYLLGMRVVSLYQNCSRIGLQSGNGHVDFGEKGRQPSLAQPVKIGEPKNGLQVQRSLRSLREHHSGQVGSRDSQKTSLVPRPDALSFGNVATWDVAFLQRLTGHERRALRAKTPFLRV